MDVGKSPFGLARSFSCILSLAAFCGHSEAQRSVANWCQNSHWLDIPTLLKEHGGYGSSLVLEVKHGHTHLGVLRQLFFSVKFTCTIHGTFIYVALHVRLSAFYPVELAFQRFIYGHDYLGTCKSFPSI